MTAVFQGVYAHMGTPLAVVPVRASDYRLPWALERSGNADQVREVVRPE